MALHTGFRLHAPVSPRPHRPYFGNGPSLPKAGALPTETAALPETDPNKALEEQYRLPGLGQSYRIDKAFTRQNVQQFCEATGDLNLEHLSGLGDSLKRGREDSSEEPKITVPGHFVTAQITRAFINMFKRFHREPIFPVYGGQKTRYESPVHAGDMVQTVLTVKNIAYKLSSATGIANVIYQLSTDIFRHDPVKHTNGQQVVRGEGTVIIRVPEDPALEALVAKISASGTDKIA